MFTLFQWFLWPSDQKEKPLEQEILESIEIAAENGAKFIVLDNMTFVCHDAEKSAEASEFMMKLVRLKKKYELTTLVIAHTPKRRGNKPITQDDLAGSAKLSSFFDACIALARSVKDGNLRYLKQVKVRTGEFKYDADNVLVLELVKENGFLHFEKRGTTSESEHLMRGGNQDDQEEILEILRLKKEGMSIRQIAKKLGLSHPKVQRRLDKAKDKGIKLPEDDSKDESTGTNDPPVSDVSEEDESIRDTPRGPPVNEYKSI